MSGQSYLFDKGGPGEVWSDAAHYAQTVTIGNIVKASGQGGWNKDRKTDPKDPVGQVKLAMENVDRVLKEAGLRGWDDVYCLRSYHIDPASTWQATVDALKERIPNHRPIWTAIGVKSLADPDMLIELEVEAIKST